MPRGVKSWVCNSYTKVAIKVDSIIALVSWWHALKEKYYFAHVARDVCKMSTKLSEQIHAFWANDCYLTGQNVSIASGIKECVC